jgi:hypothetical protein
MKRFATRCVLLAAAWLLFSCTEKHEGIRIAAPDDFCGVLAYYLVQHKELVNAAPAGEIFPLVDCCSTTMEWAMSADRIDAAWLCPDAAQNLLKKDDRFIIIGSALVNSQVLVIRKDGNPKRIAYSHKREYQRAFIQKRFGMDCETIPVMPTVLPHVYEQGNVDGVVVDILKGMTLKGKLLRLAGDGTDVVTYVLVVSKKFYGSGKFPRFFAALQDSIANLNDIGTLTKVLDEQKKLTAAEVKQIATLSIRFVSPQLHGKR